MLIRHIKRGVSRTFCGWKFSVWRAGYTEVIKKAKKSGEEDKIVKHPNMNTPLHTGTYQQSNCKTCRRAFETTAAAMGEDGTLTEMIAVFHNTRT